MSEEASTWRLTDDQRALRDRIRLIVLEEILGTVSLMAAWTPRASRQGPSATATSGS